MVDIHAFHESAGTIKKLSKREVWFWRFVLFIGVVGAVTFCGLNLSSFFTNKATSSSITVHSKGESFPDISICYSIPWNFPKLLAAGFPKKLLDNILGNTADYQPKQSNNDVTNEEADEIINNFSDGIDDFILKFGVLARTTFIQCQKGKNDCIQDTLSFFHFIYGHCLVINMTNFEQKEVNTISGLSFHLRVPEAKISEVFGEYAYGMSFEGFLLEMGNHYNEPTFEPVFINKGYFAHIMLEAHRVKRVKGLFVECNSTHHKSFKLCKHACRFNNADCRQTGYIGRSSEKKLCNPLISYGKKPNKAPQSNHVGTTETKMTGESEHVSVHDSCYQACEPHACEEISYRTSMISTPLAWYTQHLKSEHLNKSSAMNQYAGVYMTYRYIGHHLQETRDSTTIPNLISLLGGQLGLWLGFSLITMIQLAVWLIKQER